MRQSWSVIVVGLVITLAAAGGVFAQTPSAQPAGQQAAAAPAQGAVTYPGDAYIALNYIQNAKTADFEAVMGRVKEALQKSEKPERKKQAEGWKIYKSPDPSGIEGVTTYVTVIDPVVKDADYRIWPILQEGFPNEYQDLAKKYSESFNTGARKLVPINLNNVISFK